jgi:hypothetical protein
MNGNTLIITSLILSGLALVVGIYAVIAAGKVRVWRKLFGDQNERPENLEQIIASIAAKIKGLENGQLQSNVHAAQLEELLGYAVQQVGLVRFNSQVDEGGNLSFSLALLDAQRSGFVITSLHGRQQNRIYAKQITSGSSETNLSEEEQNAVFAAIKDVNKKPIQTAKQTRPKIKRVTQLKH